MSGVAPPPMPVIVGAGRSGTTLLRLMLDAHPDLAIPAETAFLPPISGLVRLQAAEDDRRRAVFETMTGFPTWPDLATRPEDLWTALLDVRPFTVGDGVRAFYGLYARQHGKTRAGDKTPDYGVNLPAVQAVLPEARFVHLIRDGRDVAVSIRPLFFAPGSDVHGLAADWVRRIRTAREQARECAHYLEVRYEDLLVRTRSELDRICAFVELEYHPAMERYYEGAARRLAEVQDRHDSVTGQLIISREARFANHRLTSRPPDPSRAGGWRHSLTPAEQADFWSVAGDLLAGLGYDRL